MPSITAFNNFVLATGNKVKSKPDEIINDAVKNTYIISRMTKGAGASDMVQSGLKIIDRIMLSDSGTAVFYNPNQDLDIQNVDTLSSIEVNWRYLANHFSYTEQEVNLNSGDSQTYYKNLLKTKRQGAVTNTFNFMEEALWAAPVSTDMEAASGTKPYSFRAFVTEAGGAPATADGATGTAWTTVQTLSPAANVKWKNQVETFDVADLANPDTGLVNAFDNMFMKVKFKAPRPGEYFENDEFQQMGIFTNRDGRAMWLRLTRDANDRLVNNDLGGQAAGVGYSGLPVEYIAELDNAGYASGSPRFFWLNLKYMHPIWHTEEYQKEKEPIHHPRQPFSWVVWTSTYYNLFCMSRRRQGIICPG